MYKIINKYYPLWKIKKYGVEILFLWGSISIWTNGYFGKIDNKTRKNAPLLNNDFEDKVTKTSSLGRGIQSHSKSDNTSAVVELIFLSNT